MIITDGEKTMTLVELACRICNSIASTDDDCAGCHDGSCPAIQYCRHGHNGMIDWLRKVLQDE